MRKHDVRKWLHAILDLLPVILIPVFMVYSHRHDVTENVQINYRYQSNEVNTLDNLVEGNLYHFDSFTFTEDIDLGTSFYFTAIRFSNLEVNNNRVLYDGFEININETYYFVFAYSSGSGLDLTINFANNMDDSYVYFSTLQMNTKLTNVEFIYNNDMKSYFEEYGYVPKYSNYNVIESVDITNTNVMDSFMNNFNNTIDKHFNMGNVFNLGDVYQWFNTNIFGGNAPVVIYSIYNIVLYELVMDLLFLLYGLFMWFIDMIQKLMEKPLNSVK